MNIEQRIPFHFHALGNAFSGTFDRPFLHEIPAQAATSLPSIGGHARARVENFRAHHFVSFKTGHTHVSGSWMDDKTVVTEANATIEELNILEFLTARRVVARLTSEGKHGQKEAHIIALGSEFDDLRIAGHPVKVTLRHNLLLDSATHEDLRKAVASDKDSGRMVGTQDGAILCSLVEKIETSLPGAVIRGHILKVPHFGEIALAEILSVPGTRTLTMIRLKLGSPSGGLAAGPEVLSQGQPMPPLPPFS
jgi:hypothetical protein